MACASTYNVQNATDSVGTHAAACDARARAAQSEPDRSLRPGNLRFEYPQELLEQPVAIWVGLSSASTAVALALCAVPLASRSYGCSCPSAGWRSGTIVYVASCVACRVHCLPVATVLSHCPAGTHVLRRAAACAACAHRTQRAGRCARVRRRTPARSHMHMHACCARAPTHHRRI